MRQPYFEQRATLHKGTRVLSVKERRDEISTLFENFARLYALLFVLAEKGFLSQRIDMTSYPDFDTLALATKLNVICVRGKLNHTQIARDAQVSLSSFSRVVGGYERFTQDAARSLLLKVSKVLVQRCQATRDEIDMVFELARNACPTGKTLSLEKKRRKLPYLYRPLDRENGELEAEILELLEKGQQQWCLEKSLFRDGVEDVSSLLSNCS